MKLVGVGFPWFRASWCSCLDPISSGRGIGSASDSFELCFGEFLCAGGGGRAKISSLKWRFPFRRMAFAGVGCT